MYVVGVSGQGAGPALAKRVEKSRSLDSASLGMTERGTQDRCGRSVLRLRRGGLGHLLEEFVQVEFDLPRAGVIRSQGFFVNRKCSPKQRLSSCIVVFCFKELS